MTYFYLLLSLFKKKLWKEFFETTVPHRLGKHEALLKSRDGGKGYFFGDKVNIQDKTTTATTNFFLHNCKLLSISKACTAYWKKEKKKHGNNFKIALIFKLYFDIPVRFNSIRQFWWSASWYDRWWCWWFACCYGQSTLSEGRGGEGTIPQLDPNSYTLSLRHRRN